MEFEGGSLGESAPQVNWLGSKVGSYLALVVHPSKEPGELSQWLCHADSTINAVIHYYYYQLNSYRLRTLWHIWMHL